ncbi:hypothetical protein V8C86DRAFT_2972140 [Haematococcus lacustris]
MQAAGSCPLPTTRHASPSCPMSVARSGGLEQGDRGAGTGEHVHVLTLMGSSITLASTRITARLHSLPLTVQRVEPSPWQLQQMSMGLPIPLPPPPPPPTSSHTSLADAAGACDSSTHADGQGDSAASWVPELTYPACVIHVAVHGIDRPGLLLLECWSGQLLTSRKPVLVLGDSQVVRELGALEGSPVELWGEAQLAGVEEPEAEERQASRRRSEDRSQVTTDLLTDLGCWVECASAMRQTGQRMLASSAGAGTGSDGGAAEHGRVSRSNDDGGGDGNQDKPLSSLLTAAVSSRAYQAKMVDVAVQLLEHSCSCGWVATASLLMSLLKSLGVDLAYVKGACGTSLLLRTVCSGSLEMVERVISWGVTQNEPWDWSAKDADTGITPLHAAAVIPAQVTAQHSLGMPGEDPGMLADWILQKYESARRHWRAAPDAVGVTPAEISAAHSWVAAVEARRQDASVRTSVPEQLVPVVEPEATLHPGRQQKPMAAPSMLLERALTAKRDSEPGLKAKRDSEPGHQEKDMGLQSSSGGAGLGSEREAVAEDEPAPPAVPHLSEMRVRRRTSGQYTQHAA